MTTPANAINVSQAGLVRFDGTSVFSGVTVTNHNAIVGATSNGLTSVAPGTAGIPLVSNGAAADPSFTTALVVGGGTGATSFTAHSLLLGQGTSAVTALGAASNGQLAIGSAGADPVLATLTPGAGISITNGAGSITIAATGAGLTWTDVTGATQTLAAQNGYVTDRGGGVTYTLPASGTLGDELVIVGKAGLATITPNANQQILIGSASGAVGVTGTAVSNNAGDCITLICITAGASTVWRANSVVGTWTLN